jgi:hypothetical protein
MRRDVAYLVSGALTAVIATAALASAQTPSSAGNQKAAKPSSKLVTVSGCIGGDNRQYVLSDAKGRSAYRLSGTDVHDYLGQHVQISGVERRRMRIAGGLYPSPNVAAQAGAINPTEAAQAAMTNAASYSALPEFDVKSIQVMPGACQER